MTKLKLKLQNGDNAAFYLVGSFVLRWNRKQDCVTIHIDCIDQGWDLSKEYSMDDVYRIIENSK